jgi:hypothetical protein
MHSPRSHFGRVHNQSTKPPVVTIGLGAEPFPELPDRTTSEYNFCADIFNEFESKNRSKSE